MITSSRKRTTWEVDWTHPENTGFQVWARNPNGHTRSSREWHFTKTGHLRAAGIATPTYRKDSWEVDWHTRQGNRVWARNPASKMPRSRKWHWVQANTLQKAGVKWQPRNHRTLTRKTFVTEAGYVQLGRGDMTDAEVRFAESNGLFTLNRRSMCLEHRFRMAQIIGGPLGKKVVRHINGIKHDNRPENLLLGTIRENNMDHNTARLAAMYWRTRFENLRDGTERAILPPPDFA